MSEREHDLNPPEYYDDGPDEDELDRRADARREAEDDAESMRKLSALLACTQIRKMLEVYGRNPTEHPFDEVARVLRRLGDIESILRGIK